MGFAGKVGKAAVGLGGSVLASEFIKVLSKEATQEFIKKNVETAGDKVVEKAKDIFSPADDFKAKYQKLRNVILSTESSIVSFEKAIFEARNMRNHSQFELDNMNSKNPATLPKYKSTMSKLEKSINLLASLRNEAANRIMKEATIVYESKNESEFFNPYSKINTALINSDSQKDFDEVLLKINRHYLKDFEATEETK